jgi:hypothetical protein
MVGRAVAAAALCVVSQTALAQYAPQPQSSAVGKGKTFCSRYDGALTIANRTAG